jgi:hypothetical protein
MMVHKTKKMLQCPQTLSHLRVARVWKRDSIGCHESGIIGITSWLYV